MVPFPTTYSPLSLDLRTPKTPIAIISRTGQFTDFNFGRYINSLHANETSLKILEKRVGGRIQGLLNFLGTPCYLRNVKFCMHIHRINRLSEQKSTKNVGKSSRGRSQGLSKIFRATIYRAHRAVIFAIAQLSCTSYIPLLLVVVVCMM